ncbi:coiled-coil domain-containing protein 22 homolog isoform X1 [Trichoplusia ni]|uniref:Coiled-coil domain-containing protein 22 homolog n=2 Tax=Trichoplusia ni TaxID=7111 RepID=A0A7E5X3R9_TRINI|nr:coiled-coil domain-containing protein 22 homolog isoform X1 [Trichoplusia ni]
MEEVDSIILHFLRQLNINIDDETKNITELPVHIIIEAASTCLSTINPSVKVTKNLPSGISQRIEVASQIASICKDLGYKNDVGYQTFLYHNECELRQVFMFLIERLPNEGKQLNTTLPLANQKSALKQDISNKIGEELKSMWIPPCCKPNTTNIGDYCYSDKTPTSSVTCLTDEQIIEKLLKIKEISQTNIIQPAATEPAQNIEQEVVVHKPETRPENKKSLKELKELAIVLRQKLDSLESEKNVMEVEFSQVQKSCERADADLKNVQNILSSIGITDIEADNVSDGLIERVQRNISSLHRQSEELTSRNLSLMVEIDKIASTMDLLEPERSRCRKILGNLKENAKALKDEYEKKEVLANQLKENYGKLRGGNKRSIYTKRILEIISNVDKQNMEIKKILDDTRQLQKEINTLEGQLDRCFSIADETLFRDAKKDDQAKKAYKLLALLHSECNTIVSLVNDTGTLARDIVDLEENIKTETAKRTEDTLRKIQADLTKIQEEN